MNTRTFVQAALSAAVLVAASSAFAASGADGSPVSGKVYGAKERAVTAQTPHLNVFKDDVVRISLADGQSFTWKFDGASNYVNLADIAPQGAKIDKNIRIYVSDVSDS